MNGARCSRIMHKLTRMRYSRNEWKDKATNRGKEIREYRKKVARKDRKIEELEEALSQATQELISKKNN